MFLSGNMSYGFFILQSFAAMAVIIAGVYFLMRLVRRWQQGNSKNSERSVKIIERVSLDPKNYLAVVEYENKRFILGVSDRGINLIHEEDAGEKTNGGKLNAAADN